MPHVLVTGAQGVLGSFVARTFREAGWDVVRAGRRSEDAGDFSLLDLDDSAAVSRSFSGADLIVNTAQHPGLSPERTVLREGGTLIDLAELSSTERSSLAAGATEARGLVVTGAGFGGISYLGIADLLRKHADADEAHYALMFSAAGAGGKAGALLGHALLTDTSHHATKRIRLPEPWGAQRPLEVNTGSARGLLPLSIGDTPIRYYLSMQPAVLQAFFRGLNAARLISHMPAAMFTTGVGKVPDEPSDEPICEWAAVSQNGRILAAQTAEGNGYYRMTAATILAIAEALTRSPTSERGMRAVEELVALPEIMPTLEGHGISVRKQPA